MKLTNTIAAIATPPGRGGIGVVRVSGSKAFEVVDKLFPSKNLLELPSHTLHYGILKHGDVVLDEVVVSLFRGPKSFTGEDVVEISCHGTPIILQQVLEALFSLGVRHAEAGEFTMRAFLNGRMDLAQAEAVADLINAESLAAQQSALHQLRGGISQKLQHLRNRLLDFASLIELELDFSEEDVEFADRTKFRELLAEIEHSLGQLLASFRQGNVVKQGISVVIAGRPNAGKSTLLNALLEEERAIVSDIPGTTRDTIEDQVQIGGILFRFIDTAGIREASDAIEKMGIERTLQSIEKAQLVIYLFDVEELSAQEVESDLQQIPPDKKLLLAANKVDKTVEEEAREKFASLHDIVFISSKQHAGIEELKQLLLQKAEVDKIEDYGMITNARHYQSLLQALESIRLVQKGLDNNLLTDLLSSDLRRTLDAIGEITGQVTNDEILGNIFGKFCIGK